MTVIEKIRLDLQSNLDGQKSPKERNILGQFATPSQLAADILAHARKLLPAGTQVNFLDPAIGTGSFYSAFITQFPANEIVSAHGFEIDPHYGLPAIGIWKESPLNLHIADFTASTPLTGAMRPNLIICNPPYVRHHHIDELSKARLAERSARSAGISISGLAGLYCHFMAIAHSWLADEGVAGWLIPSEFMDVNYGSAIRKYLTETVELIQIHRFDPTEMQFGDAQVSSAVVWFRKRKPLPTHTIKMSFGGSLSVPLMCRSVSIRELQISAKWSGLARRAAPIKLNNYKLSDLFSIKRGLATGDNSFFVLSEEKANELSIPKQFLRPVLPSPRYLESDIVEADESGMPTSIRRLYLLDCPLNAEEVLRLSVPLARYLETGREKASQTYICSRRIPWYSQERRPPAPFVCTYMGRGLQDRARPFRFILNNSNATALNVYLMLYPKPFLARALQSDPQLATAVWQVLNEISPETLLGEGRVYGGGLYKMEPKELANVPADALMALIPQTSFESMTQTEMFSELVA